MPGFQSTFGAEPAVTAAAHGRVNLIGEHTDYNRGFVLPAPLRQSTCAQLTPRPDQTVRVQSDLMQPGPLEFRLGAETPGQGWLDYVQGVTHFLAAQGQTLSGFDVCIHSDVPVGSGL